MFGFDGSADRDARLAWAALDFDLGLAVQDQKYNDDICGLPFVAIP